MPRAWKNVRRPVPRTVITPITDESQRAAAAEIWAAARRAGGRTPAPGRRERIAAKLVSSDVALLATYGDSPAGMIVAEPYAEDGVVDAVEKATDVYLAQRNDGERFLDTYRRIGMAPFKEAIYAPKLTNGEAANG